MILQSSTFITNRKLFFNAQQPVQAQQLVEGIAAIDRCRRRGGGGFHLSGPNEAADHAAGRTEVHLGPKGPTERWKKWHQQ